MARTETVTVLFTDLVGSTELANRLGHAAYETLRSAHFDALRAAVTTHNGTEVKTTGDGLMVSFASVGDAVGCAVAMQQAAEKQGRQARRPHGPPPQMRVGISVGEATREGNDLYGLPVVEAARLCAVAQPGQILAADVVRVLSRGLGHTFAPIGDLTLKGIAAPVAACAVGWEPLGDEMAMPLPPLLAAGQQFAFAGRQPELDVLVGLWNRAQEGARRVALIAGEPGIGKTRLAAETARMAHASSATVLYGRCDDELGVPFQPFVEALEYFVAHSPVDGLRERLGRHAGELVRLAPELAGKILDLPPPLQSDAETERYRMFDAVAAWLATASAERPLVLVLDDLHWAAKPTLLLFKHILRSGEFATGRGSEDGGTGVPPVRLHRPEAGATINSIGPGLLIIGTYRDTELDRTHPLSEVLADLRKDPTIQRVALGGLDLAAVEAFIAGAAGHALDEAGRTLARAVHAETEGNPFFVGEVLRHLSESGAVYQRDGQWVSDRTVEQLGIPEGVKEVIGRRLNRLSEAVNQALSLAAVIGRDFDLSVLGSVSQLDDDVLIDALDEAVRARLVNETGVVDAYRFAHALVHETLYAEVSASKRVRLHRRIADAIAARRRADVVALAYHYQQAAVGGDAEKAIDYSTRAGDQARARLAYDQAILYYRQAIELLGEGEAPAEPHGGAPARQEARPPKNNADHDTQRCELLIRLGEAQRDAGDAGFRQTLLDAAHLAQHLGDTERLARAALANTRASFAVTGRVDSERIAMLNAALDALDDADSPMRVRLIATLVSELANSPDRERLRALAGEALAMARRVGDPRSLAYALRVGYEVVGYDGASGPDTLAKRLATAAEHVALSEGLGDPVERFYAHFRFMQASRDAGDIAEADRHFAVMTELNDEISLPIPRWIFSYNRAHRAIHAGQLASAERLVTETYEIGKASGQPDALYSYVIQLFAVRRMQGRLAELEPYCVQALASYPGIASRAWVAGLYCELDRDDEARSLFERDAADGFADLTDERGLVQALMAYARVCAHLEDGRAAHVLYERLTPYRQLVLEGGPSVALYLALLATTLDRYDEADAHFAEAHAMHERIGAPYWLAVTRVDWAKMLLRRDGPGDRVRADTLLEQALAIAREYGFSGVERQATRLHDNASLSDG